MFSEVFFLAFFCATALGAVVTTVDKDDGPFIHMYLCFGGGHRDLRVMNRCIMWDYSVTQAYRDADKTPLDDADDNTLDSFTDVRVRGAGQMVPADKPRAIVHQQV